MNLTYVLRRVVEFGRDFAGASYGALGVVRHDGGFTEYVEAGFDGPHRDTTGEQVIRQVVRNARTVCRERPYRLLGVPVRTDTELVGALCVWGRPAAPFGDDDIQLVPVWYTPTEDGGIVRNLDKSTEPLVSNARALGLDIIPSISNYRDGGWDTELASRLFNDPEIRKTHVQAIVDLVIGQGWDGIDVDYEAIREEDYDAFADFLAELGTALHEDGRKLTVAIPAGTSDNTRGLAPLYRAVGKVTDEVRVMAYDKAWNESPPGPVAPLGWVEDVVEFATVHVPPDRISLGLAAHGYDWVGSDGRDKMWADARALAEQHGSPIRWNARHQVPWFTYTSSSGVEHRVWYENARSLAAKRELATEYGLGGVFVWRLGGADPRTWPEVGADGG